MKRKQSSLSKELELIAHLAPAIAGIVLSVIIYFIFRNPAFSIGVAIAGAGFSLYCVACLVSGLERAVHSERPRQDWRTVYNLKETINLVELYPAAKRRTTGSHAVRPNKRSLTAVDRPFSRERRTGTD